MRIILLILANFCILLHSYAQTTIQGSITHDGLTRTYRLYVPASYSASNAVPLIINLHGYTSDSFEQMVYGDFRSIADTAGFLVIHPQGTQDASGTNFWNAFGSPNETVDDIGFISALIDSMAFAYSIDLNRVYSTGMSNGGFMSYTLACQLSNRIAAIASVTGTMVTPNLNACNAQHPTPVMQIHGTADPTVPYLGNPQGFVGVVDLVEYWADFNNCNPTPTQTAVPNTDLTDGCTADHFVYSGGDAGSTVEFYRINAGGHTWPGSNPFFAIGVTNQDFSASNEIWRFFRQYSLSGSVGVEENAARASEFVVFPNPSNGNVSLQFKNAETRTVQVHNATGKLIQQTNFNGGSFELELENSGVFFLTVISEGGSFVQKLVVR